LVSDTPAAIRARLEQLRGEGILEPEHSSYKASEIALYGSYELLLPAADRPLTNIPDDLLTSTRISTDKRSGLVERRSNDSGVASANLCSARHDLSTF
jgi:hypothetical protein